MKSLVIGLDGIDQDLIDRYDMPFLSSVLESNVSLKADEDLWSRGWVKIASGLHPTESGAFYELPRADGSPRFSQGFENGSYDDLANQPLWRHFDKAGVSAAWFNLPTTMPASKIDGLMLSGAGGGISPADRLPERACYPKSLQGDLINARMIWENRFVVSGQRSADTFISACIDSVWKRVECYIAAVKKHGPCDFGFFVQKESVILTNVFMFDIMNKAPRWGTTEYAVFQLLRRFYIELDDCLKLLVDKLQPEKISVVSDHGAYPLKQTLNANTLLRDSGLVEFPAKIGQKHSFKYTIQQKAICAGRKMFGNNFMPIDENWIPKRTVIDHQRSKAFAHHYVPGVFINDERFGGPVTSSSESASLVSKIVELFNGNQTLRTAGIKARPYREVYSEARFQNVLPDVWLDLPAGIFPEHEGGLLAKNPFFRHWFDLRKLPRDIGSGMKARGALCSFPSEVVNAVQLDELPNDLRAAYHCIKNSV